jgi:type I restriction enzyme S subunit
MPVPAPPLTAQSGIADFLDKKTAAIDALIAKKERLIELLQEKRQALITQAVTKGLDPNVPMKDSGVEWLGEIPAHWEVKRLRHCCSAIFLGLTSRVDYVAEGGVPLVRAKDFSSGRLSFAEVRCISERQHQELTRYRAARRSDVLLSKSGSIGAVALVDTDRPFSIYESVFVLRAEPKTLLPEFLIDVMRGSACRAQYARNLVGMGVTHLNMGDFIDVLIAVPPLDEQQQIAAAVAGRTALTERLEDSVARVVGLLREYRQALITTAVTGGLDLAWERT